ncbi:HAD family hydrolase [Halosquirtibacter xylanolyticus]|uniref:haloacid dehalogenase-like hydrolase n=1 Tax=Halosquirtibacter xylanolyticus TaxID=3374599 RepID=UPI00374A03B7|nr:HAD family hydrolase [Prolixibacteraceae bacterium]
MNRRNRWGILIFVILLVLMWETFSKKDSVESLESWNNTPLKEEIVSYVKMASKQIPVEDRVAVFDLDGTLACEAPLWFEMEVAVAGLMDKLKANPSLEDQIMYQYAKKLTVNPKDTSVTNHWVVDNVNYLDSMILTAFDGVGCEAYVKYAQEYLDEHKNKDYDILFGDMFYQPMLEFVRLLQQNQFKVYIVSGSMQGLLWSVCPNTLKLDRAHLIGTRQEQVPVYIKDEPTTFVLKSGKYLPKNNHNGKSLNIYSHIGKIPVIAVGNTTGDFGMFHMANGSKYPHLAILINHDDANREYKYPPYHGTAVPAWADSMRINGWKQANMSIEFKDLWMKK